MTAAAATPGFWDWSFNPPLVLVVDLALLYWLGDRRTLTPAGHRREQRWRSLSFYASLAVLAVALSSPIELLSQTLFWAHMVQHVLLLVVAPPLMVAARPWVRLWRALPLSTRRPVARSVALGNRMAPVRSAVRFLGSPVPSFAAFSGVLLSWHVPALFDATLRSGALHALEHTLF